MIKPGCCAHCGEETWRSAPHPRTGEPVYLWPMPTARFLIYRLANGNVVNAICVCPCCTCAPGAPMHTHARVQMAQSAAHAGPERDAGYTNADVEGATLTGSATARERYAAWFVPPFGEWLRAHLRDFHRLESAGIEAIMTTWKEDRLP